MKPYNNRTHVTNNDYQYAPYSNLQRHASERMSDAHTFLYATQMALTYMEEQFGLTNVKVIDFRKKQLKEAQDEFTAAQEEFRACGGLDVLLINLDKLKLKY